LSPLPKRELSAAGGGAVMGKIGYEAADPPSIWIFFGAGKEVCRVERRGFQSDTDYIDERLLTPVPQDVCYSRPDVLGL